MTEINAYSVETKSLKMKIPLKKKMKTVGILDIKDQKYIKKMKKI